MPIEKYTKKPVAIEAIRWTGENLGEVIAFVGDHLHVESGISVLFIETLEGRLLVSPDDFIIKGVKGEFYPCKPDIFRATYDPVSGQTHCWLG